MPKVFYITFLLFLCLPLAAQGVSFSSVVINEITWMGTKSSANDEWIELYNNTENSINLDGWVLKADNGTPEINLTGIVPAKSFYLLERTDDNTVPEISADLIYKGALGNKGENLKLHDNSGNLIDNVNCSSGWLAGNNKTKQTMERTDSENWQNSQNPEGTPKAKNSIQPAEVTQPAEATQLVESKPPLAGNYPGGVIFSEILPSPEGLDAEEEWIEIFNQNSFEVSLSGWQIQDSKGKITTYTFPEGKEISAYEYFVLPRPVSKITLNNTGDSLNLIQPNGEIIDSVNFEKAPRNQSYDRTKSDWVWSDNLTPGKANIISSLEASYQPPDLKAKDRKPESLPDENNFLIKKETANISEKISQSSNFSFTLFIALVIAMISGIAILILKKISS